MMEIFPKEIIGLKYMDFGYEERQDKGAMYNG